MKIKYSSSKQWKMYTPQVKFLSYAGDIDAFWCNEHNQIFRTKHSAGVHCSFKHGIYIDGKNSRAKKRLVAAQTANNTSPLTLPTNTISQQVQNEPMWVIKSGDSEYTIALKQELKKRENKSREDIARSPSEMIKESHFWAKKSLREIQELERYGAAKSEVDEFRSRVFQALSASLDEIEDIFPGSIRMFA